MDTAVKAAGAAICAATMALVLRRHNPELALGLTLAACAAVLLAALGLADGLLELVDRAQALSGLSPAVLRPVCKCVGVGIVARLGADACKDAGSAGLASAVELAGALAAVLVSLPLFSALLAMVEGLA